MHQTLDFYTGAKKYKLRNGIEVQLTVREIINDLPRYYGHECKTNLGHIWFADGSCASGYDFDLIEAVGWKYNEPR